MKHIEKYLSLLLVTVMTVSTLTLVACTPQGDDHTEEQTQNVLKSSLSLQPEDSAFIKLSASAPMRSATKANAIEHTLTATVLPESADNKAVDWSVAWAQTSNTSPVENYVTVTPKSDGSNIATVTCLQPFTGNIIITVTTREGGFTAQCICKYVGIPTTLEVDLSGVTVVADSDWNVDVVEVDGGNSMSYHVIDLSNVFGEPGTDFTPKYRINMETHGGIYTKNTTYDASGAVIGTERVELSVTTTDFYTSGYYSAYFTAGNNMSNYVHVGIRNGQLYINGHNYPESINWVQKHGDGTNTNIVFDGFIDGKEPYVTVTLTEENTGLTFTFNVRTVGNVSQVNLDYDEIIF